MEIYISSSLQSLSCQETTTLFLWVFLWSMKEVCMCVSRVEGLSFWFKTVLRLRTYDIYIVLLFFIKNFLSRPTMCWILVCHYVVNLTHLFTIELSEEGPSTNVEPKVGTLTLVSLFLNETVNRFKFHL